MKALTVIALAALLMAAKPLSPEAQETEIKRVEAYLTGIQSIVADFSQTDSNGGVAEGKFYLKRPGKMRWEYKPPTPILLVSNGKVVTYYDSELDQVNYVAVDDTLAAFLAQPEITLNSKSTKLTAFEKAGETIRATVVLKKKPDEGSLTLELADTDKISLQNMVVTDAAGNRTRIRLSNAAFGPKLPDSLFTFQDPRGVAKRRNLRDK